MHVWLSPNSIGAHNWVKADLESGKLATAKQPEHGDWILSDNVGLGNKDLNGLMRLAGVKHTFPSERHMKAMRLLTSDTGNLPWWRILSRDRYVQAIHELLRDVRSAFELDPLGYHGHVYEPTRELLGTLAHAKIDREKWQELIDSGDGNMDALRSFHPNHAGWARPVVYDQLGTRTGRLVVTSGPNILTLKKSHRSIIKSRFEGGRIVILDYVSLEARIAALEAGIVPERDIYTDISKHVLGGATRKVAKLAVLATMYGGGARMLSSHVEPGSAEWLVDRLRSHFKVDEVVERLRAEHVKNGDYIYNKYGRRIESPAVDHILYNSYVQSTGVDIACMGFKRITDSIAERGLKTVPVFVLHDALILDAHPDEHMFISQLADVGSQVEAYTQPFPISESTVGND